MNRERKLNRMPGYDYSLPGYYFVTINVYNRENVFGEITDEGMVLNESGRIADQCWKELPDHIADCKLDEYIVMPDHFHGIVIITPPVVPVVGNRHACSLRQGHACFPQGRQYKKLPVIIGSFKSAVSKLIHQNGIEVGNRHARSLWQKSYHDRIIRDQNELNAFRKYIIENPERWRKTYAVGNRSS